MTASSATSSDPARRIDAWIVVMCAVVTALLTLLGGHLTTVARDRESLTDYVNRLLQRATDVAHISTLTLTETPVVDGPCAENDLAMLRRKIFLSPYLRDIGRLDGDQVLCSATWGKATRGSQHLPAPSLTLSKVRLWTQVTHPADASVHNDIAALGNTFVVTAPTAFHEFALPAGSPLSARVTDRPGLHLFQAFGDARPGAHGWPAPTALQRCSQNYNLCVEGKILHTGLLSAHPALAAGLALLGFFSGAGLGAIIVGRCRRHRSLPKQLARAIAGDGLSLCYQPLRAVKDRRLVGAEALARWRNEQGRWISADIFIPLAEQQGLIRPLTRRVIALALEEMGNRLRDSSDFYLSLNLSADDLLDPDFPCYLHQQVHGASIAPKRIVLELTERSTYENQALGTAIEQLRRHGYRCYIDDFGTGFANLSTLSRFPVDGLKIDKLFIRTIDTDTPTNALAARICSIAEELQMAIIIEGLEHEAQVAWICHIAPDAIGQGWLFGSPVNAQDFPQR